MVYPDQYLILLSKTSINNCKTTRFMTQCKGHAYKTAEITLLCHKVLCLSVHYYHYQCIERHSTL